MPYASTVTRPAGSIARRQPRGSCSPERPRPDRPERLKVPKALEWGLPPIGCVGETQEQRERGDTERKCATRSSKHSRKFPSTACPRLSSPNNAAAILAQPDIDGALIGGASLDAQSFAAIVEAAHADASAVVTPEGP
jgi:triosephosphate isomerase